MIEMRVHGEDRGEPRHAVARETLLDRIDVRPDPTGLLERKSADRYVLDFKGRALAGHEDAITGLVRAWTGAA